MAKDSMILPAGLSDRMPEQSRLEAQVLSRLMEVFHLAGYHVVEPPLMEFEESLLAAGPGAALAGDSFRLMDPKSGRMMALRADMTAQIARIACTRMEHWQRPLRLSYNGAVLRVYPDPLNPERQLTQIGAEMIGASLPLHDAEVASIALTALSAVGIEALTIDIGIPSLLEVLCPSPDEALVEAIKAKDHARIRQLKPKQSELICRLLDIPLASESEYAQAIKKLKGVPSPAKKMLEEALMVSNLIREAQPQVKVTLDPLESRGFDYHHGIGFAIFSPSVRGELGRGGRYHTASANSKGEESTGVTLYLERILRSLKPLAKEDRLYIPSSAGLKAHIEKITKGEAVVLGSPKAKDAKSQKAEAVSLGCSHWLKDGKVESL